MIYRRAEFKVRHDKIEEAEGIIAAFITQVHTNEPDTKIYDAFLEEDGYTFMHLMAFSGADAEEQHRNTPYLQEFVAKLYPLCEVQPVFTKLSAIGVAK
jgi:quinol monooxygenase YgiN